MGTLATTPNGAVDLTLDVRDESGAPITGLSVSVQVRDSRQRLLDWTRRTFGAAGDVTLPLPEYHPGAYLGRLELLGLGLPPGTVLWADYYLGDPSPRLVATDLVVLAAASEAATILASAGLAPTPPARVSGRATRGRARLAGFAFASAPIVGVRTVRTSLVGVVSAAERVSGEWIR